MIPVIGKNLAIALARVLLLSLVIFLILKSTGAYVASGLTYPGFLEAALTGRVAEDPARAGLPPLGPALLYSAVTMLLALMFSYGMGLPLGILLGRYRVVWAQILGHGLISVAMAVPAFWVADVVLYHSITQWGVFIGGAPKVAGEGWVKELVAKSLLLAVPLSLPGMAIVARQVAQTLTLSFPEKSLLFARSMGLVPRTMFDMVVFSVIWRPLARVLPLLGSLFFSVLVVAETAFFVPGFGYAVYKAAKEPELQSLAVLSLWVTASLLAANFVVDVMIEWMDAKHPPSPHQE